MAQRENLTIIARGLPSLLFLLPILCVLARFKAQFWNRSFILFWNRSSISKSKLCFQIKAPFENRSSILKSKLHFEIEAPKMFSLSFICKCNGTNGTPHSKNYFIISHSFIQNMFPHSYIYYTYYALIT